MSIKETLIKSREILAERGVNRNGMYIDSEGCKVCALGAIRLASGGTIEKRDWMDGSSSYTLHAPEGATDYWPASNYLERFLVESELTDPDILDGVPDFNDSSETDDQVLSFFDLAIANLPDSE